MQGFFINYFEYKVRKYSLENVRGIVSAEGRGEELQDAQLHARCLKGIYRKKMAAVWWKKLKEMLNCQYDWFYEAGTNKGSHTVHRKI